MSAKNGFGLERRRVDGECDISRRPVNREVGHVKSEDRVAFQLIGEVYQSSVGVIHRHVLILPHQVVNELQIIHRNGV